MRVISLSDRPSHLPDPEDGEASGLAVNPQPRAGAEPVQAIVARAACRVHDAVPVRGAGHGPHEPLLGLAVARVVAQGHLEARLAPHSLSA